MTDKADKQADEHPEDSATSPTGGERLAAARREQQISVLEVAKELHLDEPKVRALERNDFDMLGAPVFAKGHLRKYAKLVGVDDDDVFADYYQLTRAERLPPIIVGRKKVRRELSPGPWIAVVIVILGAAAAYWWISSREPAPAVSAPAPADEQAPAAASEAAIGGDEEVLLAAAASEEAPEEAVVEPVSEPAGSAEPEPAALADGDLRLVLVFSGDCWTEISDANGRRLFFGMGRAGRDVELTGPAPFRLLLGNVDNVAVSVNGSPYAVPPSAINNQAARLTILQP